MKRFTITRLLEISTLVCVVAGVVMCAPAWVLWLLTVLAGIALLPVLAIGVLAAFYYPIAWGVKLLGGRDEIEK